MIGYSILALTFAILPVLGLGGVPSLAARDEPCDGGAGTLLCCDTIVTADDPTLSPILNSLGIAPGSLDGLVGVTCKPIDTIDGNQSCAAKRACCTDNSFNGVIALQCTED
ncbi:fungal hydrophobin [Ganoderma leucocontextum]|nr:fungal hydrophobin [Ganoderma leucocontextum]